MMNFINEAIDHELYEILYKHTFQSRNPEGYDLALDEARTNIKQIFNREIKKAIVDELDNKLPKVLRYNITPEIASKISDYINELEAS